MRFTSAGRAVLVFGLVATITGATLDRPVAIAAGGALLALVGAAMTTTARAPNLDVTRGSASAEVPRGSPARFFMRVAPHGGRQRASTLIERVAGVDHVAVLPPLDIGASHRLEYAVPTVRRGVIEVGPARVRRQDPFGLVTADIEVPGTATVCVRPLSHRLRLLPSGRQIDLEGPTRERSAGNASFHQLRPYAPGDDPRRIHWRSSARVGTLVVRHMVDTTRPQLAIVLDNRSAVFDEDDFEAAVEVVMSLVQAAAAERYPASMACAAGGGEQLSDLSAQIDALTTVELVDDESLAALAHAVVGVDHTLLFVTGEPSAADNRSIARLAARFAGSYVISVVAERSAPFVAPAGTRGLGCSNAREFAEQWRGLR
jgi:uncharacterized protein (DUF58 family)